MIEDNVSTANRNTTRRNPIAWIGETAKKINRLNFEKIMKKSFQEKLNNLNMEIEIRLTLVLRALKEPSVYNSDMYGLQISKLGMVCDYDEVLESHSGVMLHRDGYTYSLSCLDIDKLCELADKATEYAEKESEIKLGDE